MGVSSGIMYDVYMHCLRLWHY